MEAKISEKKSRLIGVLREGVALVQMVLFKEIRAKITQMAPNDSPTDLSMLAGSVTNEVFGTLNQEGQFVAFREKNRGAIEQALLSLKNDLPDLCRHITDALRIQTLCDHQEGEDSSQTLTQAKEFGILIEEQDIPLPSTFMTTIRELGTQHNLTTPPVQISPELDQSMVN